MPMVGYVSSSGKQPQTPIPVLLVPSIWPENACVMPNWKSDLPGYLARKIRFNGFFELNQMVFRTPQITYPRDA